MKLIPGGERGINMKYKTIAVDFDGTIVEDRYPDIGPLIPEARKTLQEFKAIGGKVILWTCRTGADLSSALVYLDGVGIHIDAVNSHLPENIETFRRQFPHVLDRDVESRKIPADMYLDDRNPGGVDWNFVGKLLLS